jgi:hypothetical protein
MHNEPLASVESEPVVESSKSKLNRIKDTAVTVGFFVIPAAVVAGSMYASVKMTKTQLETARLNLEAAKLNRLKP